MLVVDTFSPGLTLTLYINQFDWKVPKGLISRMLNKGIEMTGFWFPIFVSGHIFQNEKI